MGVPTIPPVDPVPKPMPHELFIVGFMLAPHDMVLTPHVAWMLLKSKLASPLPKIAERSTFPPSPARRALSPPSWKLPLLC